MPRPDSPGLKCKIARYEPSMSTLPNWRESTAEWSGLSDSSCIVWSECTVATRFRSHREVSNGCCATRIWPTAARLDLMATTPSPSRNRGSMEVPETRKRLTINVGRLRREILTPLEAHDLSNSAGNLPRNEASQHAVQVVC